MAESGFPGILDKEGFFRKIDKTEEFHQIFMPWEDLLILDPNLKNSCFGVISNVKFSESQDFEWIPRKNRKNRGIFSSFKWYK